MYMQCIGCIKHILVCFGMSVSKSIRCIKFINQMYRVYQEVSGVSRSIRCIKGCIRCIRRVLCVSDVYKVYQTYISNEGICDILPIGWISFLPFSQIIKCVWYELNYYNLFCDFCKCPLSQKLTFICFWSKSLIVKGPKHDLTKISKCDLPNFGDQIENKHVLQKPLVELAINKINKTMEKSHGRGRIGTENGAPISIHTVLLHPLPFCSSSSICSLQNLEAGWYFLFSFFFPTLIKLNSVEFNTRVFVFLQWKLWLKSKPLSAGEWCIPG